MLWYSLCLFSSSKKRQQHEYYRNLKKIAMGLFIHTYVFGIKDKVFLPIVESFTRRWYICNYVNKPYLDLKLILALNHPVYITIDLN